MQQTYAVLRDMSRTMTDEPFGGAATLEVRDVPSEPRLEVVELDKRELRDVAHDREVQAVCPVMPTTLVRPVADEDAGSGTEETGAASGVTWGVSAVGADTSARSGADVVVAVLDTGIDSTHPAFSGVALVEQDFSGDGNGDPQGHGTHVAGTVFGRDVDGTRIGVATGVTRALIGKVLGDDGTGDSDMLFRGIQWALQEGAQVVSMSLGFDFPGMVQRLADAGWPVDLATSAGLEAYRGNLRMFDALMLLTQRQEAFTGGSVIVAASGNESKRQLDPDYEIAVSLPAAAEGVLSTGALGESSSGWVIAPFSNTLPQISAPGMGVLSAKTGGGLVSFNGTSMATPHVSGVVALWWEEAINSPLPAKATTVTARLLANASTAGFASNVNVADRGVGMVQAP
jgi:subtilisin family serine protease